MDLFSDLTSCLIYTPMDTSHLFLDLKPCLISAPKKLYKDPHSPINFPSPLRREYKVPGAWPDETRTSELDVPALHSDATAGRDSVHYDHPATSSQATSSSPNIPEKHLSEDGKTCEAELEDPQDYSPDYATHLLAAMLHEDEMKQRRENEDLYRIQCIPKKARYREDQPRQWLGEHLVRSDVRRAMAGQDRSIRASDDKVRMMQDGWERDGRADTDSTMGRGTPGGEGHRMLQSFLDRGLQKRKRAFEEDGEEIGDEGRAAKRLRKVPRGVLKTRLMKGGGRVAATAC